MNALKHRWKENILTIFKQKYQDTKIAFEAIQGNDGNKFFYDKLDDKKYLMGDVIFEVNKEYYTFEFFTDPSKEYRFSPNLKEFWEYEFPNGKRTKRQTNWPNIWKNSKIYIDKYNGSYNKFFLIAKHVNHNGSGNGIYAVGIDFVEEFISKFVLNQ
ncbi:hypothetical protein ELUMI_v1c05180 [Williamsoniiplasma luminosum]|uniref:Uncharacterized protein n=1 Tax=Williamsoniiplasma luminosum TaxID=214888 RepID=A0A2K8NTS4_9MOLU|nr:hypothetical protein [Williamsoniiplasma luminosum]ATZ17242.1 hypothetical protein ELUMI_v1c05180 [Williamsoniiplasma luminosum]